MTEQSQPISPRRRRLLRRRVIPLALTLLTLYFLAAYVVVPSAWLRYSHRHPRLDDVPGITVTAFGAPGDPLNVALIGTEAQVNAIFHRRFP
jgi:hypothetical protein